MENELERAVNALEDLIDNYAPAAGVSYLWDEARKVVDDYARGKAFQQEQTK